MDIKKIKEMIEMQGTALNKISSSMGKSFIRALNIIKESKGSIIVIGFGKSGAIGNKLVSTFRTAGRHSYLLNPVDAFHGEVASVTSDDVAIAISSSGESDEIMRIIPWLKKKSVKVIAITPLSRSSLSGAADVVLKTTRPVDATDSMASYSTCLAALAVGDMLGLSLLYEQDIEHARIDGKEMEKGEAFYTIEDLLATKPRNPVADREMMFRDALLEITSKGLGAISIVDEDRKLIGIITDGDVRRLFQKSQGSIARLFLTNVDTVMTKNPKRINSSRTLHEALNEMENNAITVLPVVDDDSKPVGMLHLHDMVQLGLGIGTEKKSKANKTKKKTQKRQPKSASAKKTAKK